MMLSSRAMSTRHSMHALARAAMTRHPAEPYLPYVVALRALLTHDDEPLPWIEATLERAQTYGPAHLLLARSLARRSPSQARFEYRLVSEQAPELEQFVSAEALPLINSYDDATELIPNGPAAEAMAEHLIVGLGPRLPASAARLNEQRRLRAPSMYEPHLSVAGSIVLDIESGPASPWCDQGPSSLRARGTGGDSSGLAVSPPPGVPLMPSRHASSSPSTRAMP